MVVIALGPSVYLWNAGSGSIEQLVSLGQQEGLVTSVSFSKAGDAVAVGTQAGEVQLWDVGTGRQTRRLLGHSARVGASSWNPGQPSLLSTGSRDTVVLTHDVRATPRASAVRSYEAHSQEVCGLSWSPDGTELASGGNDNMLCVWEGLSHDKPCHVMEQHTAAVKALAWCPWQPRLLASGGGTADRCIRFWNTATGGCLNCIDTKSQVCAIQWSRHSRELVSSHGFSQNQLTVWSYPSVLTYPSLPNSQLWAHHTPNPDGQSRGAHGPHLSRLAFESQPRRDHCRISSWG